jgi:hypothetical protein
MEVRTSIHKKLKINFSSPVINSVARSEQAFTATLGKTMATWGPFTATNFFLTIIPAAACFLASDRV